MKRNSTLIHTTIQMTLQNIMLSERNQSQHHILCDSIYIKCQIDKFIKQSRLVVSYSWVIKEKCEVTANECEVSFGSDKHISVLIGVMLVQLCDCTKNH